MERKTLFFILILTLSCLLRTVYIKNIPLRVDGDSSRFAIDGLKAWRTHQPFFATGWYGHTNGYFYLVGLVLKNFQNNLLGIRLLSALGGILAILATYLFTKELFNKKVALWTSLFLAVCPFHLVFSRVGTEVVWMTFFTPIILFLTAKKKIKHALFSGIFTGLAQYLYPGARLVPILIITFWIMLLIGKRICLKKIFVLLFFCLLGFLLIYAPMIKYYLLHPKTYWARIDIVGIFQSGWFENELKTRSFQDVLFKQIANSFSAFHLPTKGSLIWFYRTPFLDPWPIFLFTLGLIIGLFRIKKWQFQFLYFYLISGVFLAGVLTINSPSTSRYVILFPAVSCFIGIGITWIVEIFSKKKLIKNSVTFLLAGTLIAASLYSYWTHETKDVWSYDINTQIATFAGRYLATLSENYDIYFLGNDYMYYEAIPTLPFLTKKTGRDIFGPVENFSERLDFQKRNFFIVIQTRENELTILQAKFPEGKITPFYNPQGKFLFWLFEV